MKMESIEDLWKYGNPELEMIITNHKKLPLPTIKENRALVLLLLYNDGLLDNISMNKVKKWYKNYDFQKLVVQADLEMSVTHIFNEIGLVELLSDLYIIPELKIISIEQQSQDIKLLRYNSENLSLIKEVNFEHSLTDIEVEEMQYDVEKALILGNYLFAIGGISVKNGKRYEHAILITKHDLTGKFISKKIANIVVHKISSYGGKLLLTSEENEIYVFTDELKFLDSVVVKSQFLLYDGVITQNPDERSIVNKLFFDKNRLKITKLFEISDRVLQPFHITKQYIFMYSADDLFIRRFDLDGDNEQILNIEGQVTNIRSDKWIITNLDDGKLNVYDIDGNFMGIIENFYISVYVIGDTIYFLDDYEMKLRAYDLTTLELIKTVDVPELYSESMFAD